VRPFLVLLGAALALYLPCLTAPVFLDDATYVFASNYLRSPGELFWSFLLSPAYFVVTAERTWQPVVTLINRSFVDLPVFLRSLSVLIHAGCAYLVFRLSDTRRSAWFASLLFLSFPLSAETVFFASAKGHLLAAAAVLLTLLTKNPIPFAVGLLCKESVVVALPLLFLNSVLIERKSLSDSLRRLTPYFLIAAVFLLWRFFVLIPPPPMLVPAESRPLAAFAWYLGALAWPPAPGFFRAFPEGDAWIMLLLAPYAAALWHWRYEKRPLFYLLWLPAALLPFLHRVSFAGKSPVADRYLYLAAAGACLALGRLADGRARLAFAALIALWSLGTLKRTILYRDPLRFAEAGAKAAPGSAAAQLFLAQTRYEHGDALGGAKAAALASQLEPRDPENWTWRGVTAFAAKDAPAAETSFLKALELQETPQARANLGALYEETGRAALALKEYDRASELAPDWEKPRRLAADLRARSKRPPKN
jgi:tetratricopeptide (TPR) repeat protein